MILNRIELYNFRSHTEAVFSFDPRLTLVTGKNGAGKTNLLEAVYILLRGTSFRASDRELTAFERDWWRVVGELDEITRELRHQSDKLPAKQLLMHDSAKRFHYKDRLPVVLFEPTDLQLIHGSPSRRRATFDDILISLSDEYRQALSRYERSLRQRNNTLKRYGASADLQDMLFVWDVALAKYGETIISEREKLIKQINQLLPEKYSQIAGRISDVSLRYHSTSPSTSSRFIDKLHKNIGLDKVRATTSIGPHRDDFVFYLNQTDAKALASRGETRSLLLSLKLAYTALLRDLHGTEPIILLDDVFSELDSDRQKNLLSALGDSQVIITDTKIIPGTGKRIKL